MYIASKTKAGYQGTTDIKERVRDLLGIPRSSVPDAPINALDGFFTAKRHHRSPADVVKECDAVLVVANKLIRGTAALLKARWLAGASPRVRELEVSHGRMPQRASIARARGDG